MSDLEKAREIFGRLQAGQDELMAMFDAVEVVLKDALLRAHKAERERDEAREEVARLKGCLQRRQESLDMCADQRMGLRMENYAMRKAIVEVGNGSRPVAFLKQSFRKVFDEATAGTEE